MSRLLVCSECDLPSVNMRAALMSMGGWEDLGEGEGARFHAKGDVFMMSIPDMHIRHDGECGCCTDYFGITLGNVRQHSADAIFHGQRAETLRRFLAAERLPICDHCPWLGQAGHFAPASSPMADSEKAQRQ